MNAQQQQEQQRLANAVTRCEQEILSDQTVIWRTALVELAMLEGRVDPATAVRDVVMTHSARVQ